MSEVAMLLGAMLFPVAGLALILWLNRLEETLPRDVETARRHVEPPPILAIPVRSADVTRPVTIPAQRAPTETVQAFSRSAGLSLGGSTNR